MLKAECLSRVLDDQHREMLSVDQDAAFEIMDWAERAKTLEDASTELREEVEHLKGLADDAADYEERVRELERENEDLASDRDHYMSCKESAELALDDLQTDYQIATERIATLEALRDGDDGERHDLSLTARLNEAEAELRNYRSAMNRIVERNDDLAQIATAALTGKWVCIGDPDRGTEH